MDLAKVKIPVMVRFMYGIIYNMKIGVCIPCYLGHINCLDGVLLSIENQTFKPHIVSISISGILPSTIIPSFTTSFPLKISTTNLSKNAGQNRNIAVDQIKNDVDIITFFDADDFMHRRRLEIINNAFQDNTCHVFMHGYQTCSRADDADTLMKRVDQIPTTGKIFDKTSCNTTKFVATFDDNNNYVSVAAGHISFRISVFFINRVPENAIGYEDNQYTKDLFNAGYKIKFTPDMLSMYRCLGIRKDIQHTITRHKNTR